MRLKTLVKEVGRFWSDGNSLIRRWLITLAIGMFGAWLAWQFVSRPTVLTIAVGASGGQQAAFVKAVARRMRQAGKPVRLKVVAVADDETALARFNAAAVDLAVLRSDQPNVADARSFAILDKRAIMFVALADPGATTGAAGKSATEKSADDSSESSPATGPLAASRLIGRRIAIVREEHGLNLALVRRLLAHSGLDGAAVTLTEIDADKLAATVATRQADIVALVANPTTGATRHQIGELARAFGGPLVVGSPPSPEALNAVHRDVGTMELQVGVLGGNAPLPAQKTTTVAVTEEIVGRSDIEETVGAQFSKTLLEVRGRLSAEPDLGFEIEAPPLDTQRRFMPHAGVSAHINDRATSFLEKYSDQIWLALFALGLIGSSVASFAGRLGLVGRDAPEDPLPGDIEHLLGAIAAAGSPGEVDQIRGALRSLAAERLRRAVAEGLDTSDARHPNQWFALIDALAVSRRDELATPSAPAPAREPARVA